jgi:hypothetical protein
VRKSLRQGLACRRSRRTPDLARRAPSRRTGRSRIGRTSRSPYLSKVDDGAMTPGSPPYGGGSKRSGAAFGHPSCSGPPIRASGSAERSCPAPRLPTPNLAPLTPARVRLWHLSRSAGNRWGAGAGT